MNAQTKVSAKGQVVIPKDVRERLGWPQGSELEVIETSGGVLLRKPPERKKLSFEEATAQLRKIVNYKGPPLTIEQLSWSAEADREYQRSKLSKK
jgi:AbrB family looped-hinge helix DNA binding protein